MTQRCKLAEWSYRGAKSLVVACAFLTLVGCSDSPSPEAYVPPADRARQFLEQALTAWRSGEPRTSFPGSPKIEFGDSEAKAGRKLVEFEILGELPTDSGRRFQVRFKFDDPPDAGRRQYVVVGIDPIWVIEQENFNMMTHWDHPMPAATSGAVDPGTKSSEPAAP